MKTFCSTLIWYLEIEEYDDYIISIKLVKKLNYNEYINDSVLLSRTKQQIDEYFLGRGKVFDLPIKFKGTEFQKSYGIIY